MSSESYLKDVAVGVTQSQGVSPPARGLTGRVTRSDTFINDTARVIARTYQMAFNRILRLEYSTSWPRYAQRSARTHV